MDPIPAQWEGTGVQSASSRMTVTAVAAPRLAKGIPSVASCTQLRPTLGPRVELDASESIIDAELKLWVLLQRDRITGPVLALDPPVCVCIALDDSDFRPPV